jgi:hypothetical protein
VGVVSAKGRLIANHTPNVVAAYLNISLIWLERQRIKIMGRSRNTGKNLVEIETASAMELYK